MFLVKMAKVAVNQGDESKLEDFLELDSFLKKIEEDIIDLNDLPCLGNSFESLNHRNDSSQDCSKAPQDSTSSTSFKSCSNFRCNLKF